MIYDKAGRLAYYDPNSIVFDPFIGIADDLALDKVSRSIHALCGELGITQAQKLELIGIDCWFS